MSRDKYTTDEQLLRMAYAALVGSPTEFAGRRTAEGQAFLSELRSRVAQIEGESDQDTQDKYENPQGKYERNFNVLKDFK